MTCTRTAREDLAFVYAGLAQGRDPDWEGLQAELLLRRVIGEPRCAEPMGPRRMSALRLWPLGDLLPLLLGSTTRPVYGG